MLFIDSIAANFLGVTVPTAMNYYSLSVLPEELQGMVDKGILGSGQANIIAKNTFDATHEQKSQESMKERASWFLDFDRDARKLAMESIKSMGKKASIADLNKDVIKRRDESGTKIEYLIPQALHGSFLNWGKERGLKDETAIIGHMVTEVLKRTKA